ncbi:nucleoredoxin-like [Frankliniella occidentalis]|uniref:Nucleoredoxin-like n=1 Tax=Frankliniella occidentalis TaxID=133901 RepID=A0A9C6X379_FRAOC|nr:nucleoredoxin-like [Frankliniella occidentalis]
MTSTPWYRAILGDVLARWAQREQDGDNDKDASSPTGRRSWTLVPTAEALAGDPEVVALYFPPLLGDDDLAERLLELHHRVNDAQEPGRGRLRVVQVLSPLAAASSPSSPTAAPRLHIEVPWFAVPPDDYDRQRRLCGRYRVRADVALSRLLLVDARSGRLVSRCGRERLLADPKGLSFPWPARPLPQVLAEASLQQPAAGAAASAPAHGRALLDELRAAAPAAGVVGVYFSAHWCPPCKAFTPQLVRTYNAVRERGISFEVIFVSSDRSVSARRFATLPPCLSFCLSSPRSPFPTFPGT